MSLPKLLTISKLADAFGWTYSKVDRHVRTGKIPYVRIAGRVHFREAEVLAWLEEQQVPVKDAPRRSRLEVDPTREEMCRELGIEPDHQFT